MSEIAENFKYNFKEILKAKLGELGYYHPYINILRLMFFENMN